MTRRCVVLAAPRRIEVREDDVPTPGEGEVLVRTLVSGISAGTELHFYRGDVPEGVALDESLPTLQGRFHYPAAYGYASVGEVVDDGRRVFSFHPHASHFVARDEDLFAVPDTLTSDVAALWPTAETAVNLVLDARPLVGERVLVVGQGVVGLLTTALLSRFPLSRLWTADPLEPRRVASMRCGADSALDPGDPPSGLDDFDVTIELSGTAAGLDLAIRATGFEGRIVVGSWYRESAPVSLGTHFHRGRLQIASSQVSRIGSLLASRWTKSRRMQVAAEFLPALPAAELITHRFPVTRAPEAYELLDRNPEACLQVLLTYT